MQYSSSKTYLAYFNLVSDTLNHHKILIFGASDLGGAGHGDELSYIFSNELGSIPSNTTKEFRNIQKVVST